jgi:hypothetical protein
MKLGNERRRAHTLIEHHGLELKQVIIDREGGSLAIGRKADSSYDSPTFSREEDALLWVLQNTEAIERISQGKPYIVSFWLVDRMEEAAREAASPEAFVESLEGNLAKVKSEAERHRDDELRDIADGIRDMEGQHPSEIIARERDAFGVPDFSNKPGM